MYKVKVVTEHSHPLTSPDYLYPDGCVNDNNNNNNFLYELNNSMRKKYSLLDLGCAGGQLVVDIARQGYLSVGIEGGNIDEILTKGAGSQNWKDYRNICLFSADITKEFKVLDETNELIKFDIITTWDVLEHPLPEEIPFVLDNIKNHLKEDGMFIGTINTTESHDEYLRHRCAKDKKWWDEMFISKGFVVDKYPFSVTPRPYSGVTYGENGTDYAACFKRGK